MKTIAFGLSALVIVVVALVGLIQIVNVDTRTVSLQETLHGAMEASLDTALNTRAYTIDDEDQLVADVVQGMVLELNNPQVKLEIQVNKVDRVVGIISMKVTATYTSVSGSKSNVSVERTVILEHVNNAPASGSHLVMFKSSTGEVVKSYTLKANSQKLPYPVHNAGADKSFLGWELDGVFYANDEAGQTALRNLSLDKDYLFVARVG